MRRINPFKPQGIGILVLVTVLFGGCGSLIEPAPFPRTQNTPPPQRPVPQTQPNSLQAPPPAADISPAPTAHKGPARQFKLGPASQALVTQAHQQANAGDFGLAVATLERAMRIEPDNPLLWIESGRVRLTAGDASQADSMGRKALALATGDPQAQSLAWRLVSDSLRNRGRNQEASEAARHADTLSAH